MPLAKRLETIAGESVDAAYLLAGARRNCNPELAKNTAKDRSFRLYTHYVELAGILG